MKTFELKLMGCQVCRRLKPRDPDHWLELATGGFYPVCRECEDRIKKKRSRDLKKEAARAATYMAATRGTL
jgi:hypothetical protein